MPELLLELFSEEIPARMQARAAADLQRLVSDKLKEAGLSWSRAECFATPRRLTLVVDGLPTDTPDTVDERKGPKADAPAQAIEGFLKSAGVTRDQVETRNTGKGLVLFAVIKKQGRKTADVIADALQPVLHGLPWPKSMRWGDGSLRWVRPLQSILCVFGGKAVHAAIEGVAVGNQTRGHRFLAPDAFTVTDFADYKAKLEKAYVILSADDRKAKISTEAQALAKNAGLALMEDNALLDEVAGLVEWPVALMGSFDPAFLDVPAEVLTATMRANQKYFSLQTKKSVRPERVEGRAASGFDGLSPNGDEFTLAPKFIVISNMETPDAGKAIVAGNERVLKARLADAKFFWDQDLKRKLEDRLPDLANITFYEGLGSIKDKSIRIAELSAHIAKNYIEGVDDQLAGKAGELAKADLAAGVVGEFPELQGIMGGYYALAQGLPQSVADAISQQYSPKGPDDNCPKQPMAIAVAMADKLDTLAAFFSKGLKPTGSKDPYALRRAALGIIRLIMENGLRIQLGELIAKADNELPNSEKGWDGKVKVRELLDFFADRLKVQQREKGIRHDLIDAVFSLGGEDDLVRLIDRVQALQQMLTTEDGANLLAAYRRGSNIVGIEEKKDKRAYTGGVDVDQLKLPEEQALYRKLQDVQAKVADAVKAERWIGAMTAVAALRAPIDAFFDKVTVNDADASLRQNRLNLLAEFRAVLGAVADFSKIEG